MRNIFRSLTGQKPYIYGLGYLILIPTYACLYSYWPEATLKLNEHDSGFSSSFYFSVITITTLGYGDITPIGKVSQWLTASESVIGITFIGLFLNSLSHQHGLEVQNQEKSVEEEKRKKTAKERLLSFNKLVELNIKRYLIYTIPITSPISDRKHDQVNEEFSFNDMHDLFKPTLRLTDHHFTPAITHYFKQQHNLELLLEDLVRLGYLELWPSLEDRCLIFIAICKELDFSDYILNQPNTTLGDKKGSEFDAEMIENHEGEVKYLNSNSINAYVALYRLIKANFEFIRKYRHSIDEIKNG